METVTFESIQNNLCNSGKIDEFIGESFENSNIEYIFNSTNTPHYITFITERIICN